MTRRNIKPMMELLSQAEICFDFVEVNGLTDTAGSALELVQDIPVDDWRIDRLKTILEQKRVPDDSIWLGATQAVYDWADISGWDTRNRERSGISLSYRQQALNLKKQGKSTAEIQAALAAKGIIKSRRQIQRYTSAKKTEKPLRHPLTVAFVRLLPDGHEQATTHQTDASCRTARGARGR